MSKPGPKVEEEEDGKEVILHCDLDAFYCQVEQVRLGIEGDIPVAVQQWHSLIATNYPARDHSVTRHSSVSLAKAQCPQIQLVHVPTYRLGEREWKYRTHNPRQECKVSLASYRQASARIFSILRRFGRVEKASIDEAYIVLDSSFIRGGGVDDPSSDGCIVVGGGSHSDSHSHSPVADDADILRAGRVARQIQSEIMRQLKYTISIGVSRFKSTSKLLSSMHKPNKVSLLLDSNVMEFMDTVPFRKIGSYGGKIGHEVISRLDIPGLSYETVRCGQLFHVSREEFSRVGFANVYDVIRGQYREAVMDKSMLNSMLSAKAFGAATGYDMAMRWLELLCFELFDRMAEEFRLNRRWPKTITVQSQTEGGRPIFTKTLTTGRLQHEDALFTITSKTIKRDDWQPSHRLSVTCSNFNNHQDIGQMMSRIMPAPAPTPKGQDAEEWPLVDVLKPPHEIPLISRCMRCADVLIFREDFHLHLDYHVALSLQEKNPRKSPVAEEDQQPKKKRPRTMMEK
eukprot:Partr_v1_DN28680_c0_g1_i2_m50103 putative DNA polymerase